MSTQLTIRRPLYSTDLGPFILFYFLTLISLFIGIFSRTFLPKNYSFDGNSIQAIAQGRPYYEPDASYASAGLFYRYLGLAELPWLIAPIGVILTAVVIWWVNHRALIAKDITAWIFSTVSLGLSSIYLSWYSKDLILLIFMAGIFFLIGNAKFLDAFLVFVYAFVFRQYWFAIGALYLSYRLYLRNRVPSLKFWFVSSLVGLLGLVVAYSAITGRDVSTLRDTINEIRVGSIDAKTIIRTQFQSGGVPVGFLNSSIVFLSLLFPLPLAALGQIVYIGAAITLSLVWLVFTLRLKSRFSLDSAEVRQKKLSISSLVISVLVVGSLFEPDYGSYIRHLSVILPFLTYVVSKPYARDEK